MSDDNRSLLRRGSVVGLALVFAVVAHSAPAPPFVADNPSAYLEHVEFLAAPEMKGRGAGSPELDEAAAYIADHFKNAGLEPAGDDGSYFQKLGVTTGAKMGVDNRLDVTRNRGTEKLKPGEDYIPINFSGSGEVSGRAVFAGYGVSADEFGYDDYFHFDVKDKIVILLRYEPDFFEDDDDDDRDKRGRRRRFTRHSHLISKAINARDRGARAVILVEGSASRRGKDSLIKFGSISGPADAGIPMVQVKTAVVEKWLRGSGRSLRILRRDINGKHEPQSFALADSLSIDLSVDVDREQAMVSNVAGYLPGETDEYVVIGAHYDHLGLGDQSSLAPSKIGDVHPGADDNASGTAGLIELARHYGAVAGKPKRGLLFLAFAAEEIGLLGSRHWVENPTLPIDNAVSMLNMDMVGRVNNGKVYVGGIGTAEPFEAMLDEVKDDYSFQVDVSRSGYSASDHTSFVGKKIPVMFFFSGLHSDYHKPSDTVDKIDPDSAVELLAMVSSLTNRVVDADARPAFIDGTPESGHGQVSSAGSGRGGYGPWFGSIPDFGEVPEGVKFADIRPDSPAEKAGLKPGDILTKWNDKPIKNLYDFTYALRDSAIGDVVTVRFLREGKDRSADVKLAPRP